MTDSLLQDETGSYIGVGSYLDRHGKRRWRFRRGDIVVQLPGNPAESPENRAAYIDAIKCPPVRKKTREDIRLAVRREEIAYFYFREWITHARNRRKKRGLTFGLTAEHLTTLLVEQNFKCVVSGLEVEFRTAFRKQYERHPFAASVDRIDNDLGYEEGNVRIVCLIVNIARSDFGDEALFKMARAIAAYES